MQVEGFPFLLLSLLRELEGRRTRLLSIRRWSLLSHLYLFAHYRVFWRRQSTAAPIGTPGGRVRTVQFPLLVHSYRTLSLFRRVLLGIVSPFNLSELLVALNRINLQSTQLLESNLPDFVSVRIGSFLGLDSSSAVFSPLHERDRFLELDHL